MHHREPDFGWQPRLKCIFSLIFQDPDQPKVRELEPVGEVVAYVMIG